MTKEQIGELFESYEWDLSPAITHIDDFDPINGEYCKALGLRKSPRSYLTLTIGGKEYVISKNTPSKHAISICKSPKELHKRIERFVNALPFCGFVGHPDYIEQPIFKYGPFECVIFRTEWSINDYGDPETWHEVILLLGDGTIANIMFDRPNGPTPEENIEHIFDAMSYLSGRESQLPISQLMGNCDGCSRI